MSQLEEIKKLKAELEKSKREILDLKNIKFSMETNKNIVFYFLWYNF